VLNDLVDFTDMLPTFVELAVAKLPQGVPIDGHSFAPQVHGEKGNPREWLFVQLGRKWYVRDDGWKLNQAGELFDMKDAPFVEQLVPADAQDPAAIAARARLQAVLDQLNPAGGKTLPAANEIAAQGRAGKRTERQKLRRQQRRAARQTQPE
jgi:arylsulfatase A